MLRPVFDRTALRWLGISLRSSQKESSAKVGRSRSNGGGTGRMGLGPSHPRSTGFKQMPESEEHLAWELRAMDGKFSEQKTTVQATRTSDEEVDQQSRQLGASHRNILVTSETIIEGRHHIDGIVAVDK